MTYVVELRGVHKTFGDVTVLGGVDLAVPEGDVVTLIGASGSGKSTLLKCVNLLERIDDGQIFLDGRDITDPRVDANQVRAQIGVVFQAYNLFPHLTVHDNVTLALRLVHHHDAAAASAAAATILARVGLAAFSDAYPDRLSGGQQQRVAIARAVASAPRLLLLDEVTSALDPELVGEVLGLIRELAGATTILMATHEMAFAREVSDTVCFLDAGKIIESGPPAQVFGAPTQPRTAQFLARVTS